MRLGKCFSVIFTKKLIYLNIALKEVRVAAMRLHPNKRNITNIYCLGQ